jgi:hypothetical protein
MKNFTLLFFSLLFLSNTFAQTALLNYDFVQDSLAYRPLAWDYPNRVEIDSIGDYDAFPVGIGFDFEFGGAVFANLQIMSDGELTLADPVQAPDRMWAIAALATNLYDKFNDTSGLNSRISYVLAGSPGQRKFIVEYGQMGFVNGASSDQTSFQIWLYEGSNRIEFRYGQTQLANPGDIFTPLYSPVIGLLDIDWITEGATGLYLDGDATKPSVVPQTGSLAYVGIDSAPDSGTVYRFCPGSCQTNTRISQLRAEDWQFQLYPNPSQDQTHLRFVLPEPGSVDLRLLNLNGSVIWQQAHGLMMPGMQDMGFSVADLPPGIYVVQLQLADGVLTQKLQVLP